MRAGALSRKYIDRRIRGSEAPSIIALSRKDFGIPMKYCRRLNIAKPLGELQDKTLAGVKALPIQIEELAKNKVIQTQEQLGNVANVAKEHAGNLVTGVQNRLEQLFSKAKVGGKKSKRHMRPLKNRKTKSKNK